MEKNYIINKTLYKKELNIEEPERLSNILFIY